MNFNTITMLLLTVLACSRKPTVIEPDDKALEEKWKESIEYAKAQNEIEDRAIQEAMKGIDASFESSPYGGYFAILKSNEEGGPIQYGNLVQFIYQIRSLDGTILYTFVQNGTKELKIDKQEMLSGINDLLKHFKEGEEGILLLPSNKAFGKLGDFEKVNSDMPIWVDVKILKVKKE